MELNLKQVRIALRKMQERLKEKMYENIEGRRFRILYEDEVDKIVREVLEDTK